MSRPDDLYTTDFYAWTQAQAALLEAGDLDRLDTAHLIEELQLMGGSARGELGNRLIVLVSHLLKLHLASQHFPRDLQRAGPGWRTTCRTQRRHVAKVLRRNPSLRPTVPEEVEDAYDVARLEACAALGTSEDAVPLTCPWTAAQVLQEDFFGEGACP